MAQQARQTEAVIPQEVSRLLKERTEVRGWLEKLSELREDAIPEVYEKVEADYRGRLEEMGERLATHRSELEASLAIREERAETLQAERNERAAELEEARLRHFVGEHDDATWEERREAGEDAIGELDRRLEGERGALEAIRDALAALSGANALPGEASPTTATGEEARSGAQARREVARVETVPESVESPVSESVETPEAEAREEDPGQGEPEGEGEGEFLDELEFLESLSLEDSERFDAVSAMLEGEEGEEERD